MTVTAENVNTKRYLYKKFPNYYEKLSKASLKMLIRKGGLMNDLEMKTFELRPYFPEILKVRIWDEQANDKNAPDIDLELIFQQIDELLYSYEL